jgi:hypothetical protein
MSSEVDLTIEARLNGAENQQTIGNIATAFSIDQQQAASAVSSLVDNLKARLRRNMLSRGGIADVLSLVTRPPLAQDLSEPTTLASAAVAEQGNRILDVLIGNKHVSRGIAASAASQAGLDEGTVEKMLPVVASLLIADLQRQAQPALENLVRNVPGLVSAGGSPLPLPGDVFPPASASDGAAPAYVPAGSGTRTAPLGPIDAGRPLPLPGDNIPGLGRAPAPQPGTEPPSPYDRLPDIVRRGGPQVPGDGSLADVIRSILGNLLGSGNRGVIGTMIELFIIRWLASIARRVLSRISGR